MSSCNKVTVLIQADAILNLWIANAICLGGIQGHFKASASWICLGVVVGFATSLPGITTVSPAETDTECVSSMALSYVRERGQYICV